MNVFKINGEVLSRDYNGCGKAWAAIKDGEVVGLVYMGQFEQPQALPTPASDFLAELRKINPNRTQTFARREAVRTGMVRTMAEFDRMIAAEHFAKLQAEKDAFVTHRETSREELGKRGEVVSGMCSCTEFVAQ